MNMDSLFEDGFESITSIARHVTALSDVGDLLAQLQAGAAQLARVQHHWHVLQQCVNAESDELNALVDLQNNNNEEDGGVNDGDSGDAGEALAARVSHMEEAVKGRVTRSLEHDSWTSDSHRCCQALARLSAPPTSTATEASGDQDAELQLDSVCVTTRIDPWTKRPITQPIVNRHCGHVYDRASLSSVLERGRGKLRCPHVGCSNQVRLCWDDMVDDLTAASH